MFWSGNSSGGETHTRESARANGLSRHNQPKVQMAIMGHLRSELPHGCSGEPSTTMVQSGPKHLRPVFHWTGAEH